MSLSPRSKELHIAGYTLIVYDQDASMRKRFLPLLRASIRKHPCRVLFLHERTTGDPDHLVKELTLESLDDTDTRFVCERIDIEFGEGQTGRIAIDLLSQALPDLPIYLIWGGLAQTSHPIIQVLAPYLSQVIFMPEPSYDPQRYSASLLRFSQELSKDIADLAWAQASPWRQAMRAAFNCPDRVQFLNSCTALRISYTSGSLSDCPSAVYLHSWLAAQLSWELNAKDKQRLSYRASQGLIQVSLLPVEGAADEEGMVQTVHMTCATGETLLFTRDAKRLVVRLEIQSPGNGPIPYTIDLPTRPREQVLALLLFSQGTHPQYQRVLELIAGSHDHCRIQG